jgi:hypothetical protein
VQSHVDSTCRTHRNDQEDFAEKALDAAEDARPRNKIHAKIIECRYILPYESAP